MGLHCDPCELLLTGGDERKAPDGNCPRCGSKMDVTRPVTAAEREEIVRLIREGKTRVEGDEQKNCPMNPTCASCGHPWTDHRFVWEPYMSSFGPCAYPCKLNSFDFDPRKGEPPCLCEKFTTRKED